MAELNSNLAVWRDRQNLKLKFCVFYIVEIYQKVLASKF